MKQLLHGIPVGEMNTSMTINATAAWLLGLYVANAEDQGVASKELRGTTQNDIVKEYLSRGTYIFPPEPSKRLIVDMIAFCAEWIPKWNPMNVCSYHLQEAGATPTAGAGVQPGDRDRRARRGARLRTGCGRPIPHRCRVRSRSSSTPASASSRKSARCGPSPNFGIASRSSATASPTRSCDGSATACR